MRCEAFSEANVIPQSIVAVVHFIITPLSPLNSKQTPPNLTCIRTASTRETTSAASENCLMRCL